MVPGGHNISMRVLFAIRCKRGNCSRRRQPIQRSRGGRRAHVDLVPGAELQARGRPLRA